MKCSCSKTSTFKKRQPRFHITPADGLHNTDSHSSPTPSQLWSWCDYRYARQKFESWARSFDGVTSRCEYSLPPVPPYSCSEFEEKQRLLPPLFQVVEDDKTLGSYDIEKIKSFYLVEIGTVQIFVKTLTGKTLSCWMSSGATVESLKEELEAIEGIPIGTTHFSWFQCILRRWPTDMQRIIFAGKSLEDSNASLLQYNVKEWSTLHLLLRLRGGGTLSDDLTFAGVCREWNGDMANVIINGAQGVCLLTWN